MIRVMAAALVVAAPAALAQTPAASLDWMAGTWTQVRGDEVVTETWLGPRNGVLVGANLTAWGNGRKSFEFMRIAETAEGMSFFASPGGRAPVEFRLAESAERRVVFESADNAYPRRILYWRDGDAFMARIEGTVRGEPRHEAWRFTRQ